MRPAMPYLLFLSVVFTFSTGCTIVESTRPGQCFEIRWHVLKSLSNAVSNSLEEDEEPSWKSSMDQAWEEGYGFNNPNKRKYLPQK